MDATKHRIQPDHAQHSISLGDISISMTENFCTIENIANALILTDD